MTGKYAHANGCVDNEYGLFPDQETLPAVLGGAGYQTAFVGKWHLGYGPYTKEKRHGFDYMAANNCDHRHNEISYFENEDGPFPIDTLGPTGETDLALRFMARHQEKSDGAPFCLFMSWGPPHWDRNDYDKYPEQFNIYDPAQCAQTDVGVCQEGIGSLLRQHHRARS